MGSAVYRLAIEIGIGPELGEFGSLILTWHGIFTALGIAVAVFIAVVIGQRRGFLEDDVYSAALAAIPAGIVGARALYVVERWSAFSDDPWDILRLNEGGISIYGAVLGGLVGLLIYVVIRKLDVRRALDVAAFAVLPGMAVGRIGDLINGEHFAETTGLPWGVRYTHIDSPSLIGHPLTECLATANISGVCAQHPAVAYELIGDLLIFGLLFLIVRYAKVDGMAFFGAVLLYSLMRFGVSELRLDSREIFAGLSTPQVTALFLVPMSLIGLLYSWRQRASAPPDEAEATGSPAG